jgi:PTS system mannose-specific IID component
MTAAGDGAPRGRSTGVAGEVTRAERAGIFWRSLFLQAVWNPRGMQSVGFCFALMPLLKRCGSNADARRAFLKRHLRFFNTNPTLAPYAMGAAAEREAAGADEAAISLAKKGLTSLLGMSGDGLMWWALRPLAGIAAVLVAMEGSVWAVAVLVGLYGVPHLVLKARGIAVGADRGPSGARELTGPRFKAAVRALRAVAAFCAGLLLALAASHGGTVEPWRLVGMLLFLALAYVAHRVRIPGTVIALGGAAGGVVLLLTGLNGG